MCEFSRLCRRLGEPYLLASRALLAQLSAGNGRVESPEVGPLLSPGVWGTLEVQSQKWCNDFNGWKCLLACWYHFLCMWGLMQDCLSPKMKYSTCMYMSCVPRPRSQTTSEKKKNWQVAGEAPVEEFQQTAKLVEQEVAPEGSEMQASMLASMSFPSPESWLMFFGENKNRWF